MDPVGNIRTLAASVAKTTAPGASIGSSAKTEPSSLSGVRSTTRASQSPMERNRNPWRPRGDAASAAALVSIDIAAKNHIDLQMVTGSKPILFFSTKANINLRGYPGGHSASSPAVWASVPKKVSHRRQDADVAARSIPGVPVHPRRV